MKKLNSEIVLWGRFLLNFKLFDFGLPINFLWKKLVFRVRDARTTTTCISEFVDQRDTIVIHGDLGNKKFSIEVNRGMRTIQLATLFFPYRISRGISKLKDYKTKAGRQKPISDLSSKCKNECI